jgi:hypothetical protein
VQTETQRAQFDESAAEVLSYSQGLYRCPACATHARRRDFGVGFAVFEGVNVNMKLRLMAAFCTLLFGLLGGVNAHAAAAEPRVNPPVAKLDGITGQVEFSRDGRQWRALTRAKYLFAGNQVRTGANSTAIVLNQATGAQQTLAANSSIRVATGGVQVVRGTLSAPESDGSGFWSALVNKFNKAQRYTTVRRSREPAPCKVETVGRLTVSAAHPELVWRNAGPNCAYRLTIGTQVIDVPVSPTAEMVRYRIAELPAGEHPFKVETVAAGVVNAPTRTSTLRWQTAEEAARVAAEESRMRAANDDILLASFYEDQGLLVPAMDTLRNFMIANPDENELRPLLIKTYGDLRLDDLKDLENKAYAAAAAGG